jgi:nitrogen fixation protein FixH
MAKSDSNSNWRNPWVIGIIVVLTIFVLANVYTIYLTTQDVPGLVVDNYYERGQYYEENMLKRQAEDPGWKMKVAAPELIKVGKKEFINVTVTDGDAKPVNQESVMFHLYRPADSTKDFSLPMKRIDDGLYEVEVSFPLPGVWDVLVALPFKDYEINLPHRFEVDK